MIHKLTLLILIGILLPFFNPPPTQNEPLINNDQIESGFVFSGDATFYGLNINTAPGEIRFKIVKSGVYRILLIESDIYNETMTLAGFNSSGRFIAGQSTKNTESDQRDILYNNEFMLNYLSDSNIEDIEGWLNEQDNIFHLSGNKFLLSTQYSTIGLVEIFDDTYNFMPSENRYKILLPIPENSFEGDQPNILSGTNYNFIYDFLAFEIEENINNFNLHTHFSMAHQVKINPSDSVSILVSPAQNHIYVTINNNPDNIWMINLDGGTIETYDGFDQFHKGNIPIIGITSKDLYILDFSNETLMIGIIFGASIILTIIGLTVFLNLRKLTEN